MYNSADISKRIKTIAEKQKIQIKAMLEEYGLGINTLSNMNSGRMPLSDTVAKIADYLGVSVDYLLGRTDFSEMVVSDDQLTVLTSVEAEIIKSYRSNPQLQEAVNRILLPNKASEIELQILTKKESLKLAADGGDFKAQGKKNKLT